MVVVTGKAWQSPGKEPRIDLTFSAQAIDNSPRARAMLGIMPMAKSDAQGRRRYRIVGPLASPKVIGLG